MIRVGSLCTGYGGIEMGLQLAGLDVDLRWVAETAPELSPIHGDVTNHGDLRGMDYAAVAPVSLLTAGFPCQPVSAAGKQRGDTDNRWLWPEVHRAVRELRPAQLLIENVRNLVAWEKGRLWAGILADLGQMGYAVRWLILGACHVGAAHHRHRVFALATQTGHPTDEVERVPTSFCGAKNGAVLPRGTPSAETAAARVEAGRRNLDDAVALLPTPTASDHTGAGHGTMEGAASLRTEVAQLSAALLPTPTVGDSRNSRNATANRRPGSAPANSGTTLSDFAHAITELLPTPRASDGVKGSPNQHGKSGDLMLSSAAQPQHWGRFADAVARHAERFGPSPAPTEPNRNGAPRLSPAFAEWLMCIPAGHVTSHLTRVPALRAIGNGVCPPQLAAAWALLNSGAR